MSSRHVLSPPRASTARALLLLGLAGLAGLVFSGGCATIRGWLPGKAAAPRSSELSAEQHAGAADAVDTEARALVQQYIDRQKLQQACEGEARPEADSVCGVQVAEDSDPLLVKADELRKRAAQHRTTAEELRGSEQRACAGVVLPPDEVDDLFRAQSLESVEALERPVPFTSRPELAGAKLAVRFRPGWTVEAVQRAIDCHIARNRRQGHGRSGLRYSHLLPAGVTAEVRPLALGFEVLLSSPDAFVARVVLEHARVRLSERSR